MTPLAIVLTGEERYELDETDHPARMLPSPTENCVQSQEETPKGDLVCGQDINGVKRNERNASEATHGRANDEKQKINLNCSSMAVHRR